MKRNEAFWGGLLVVVGALLLLERVFGIGFGRAVWPLILVAAGLWILWQSTREHEPLEAEEASIPLGGARRARIDLEHGLGRLHISAASPTAELVSGTFVGGVDYRVTSDGDRVRVRLRPPRDLWPSLLMPWIGSGKGLRWNVLLNQETELYLDISGGLNSNTIDLSELQVRELRLKGGLSSTELVLPASAGESRVHVDCGLGSMRIRVPEGVAVRIQASSGLGSVSVDRSRFPGSEGRFQSPGYDTAENRVDLRVQSGLGSLNIS